MPFQYCITLLQKNIYKVYKLILMVFSLNFKIHITWQLHNNTYLQLEL